MFKGKPPGDYHLPASLVDLATASHGSMCIELIKVFQLALDNGLYCDIMSFINLKMCLGFPKPNPYSFCAPVVRLLFTFLCHQPDHRTEKKFINKFIYLATPSMILPVKYDVCHATDRQQCVLHEFCFWEMFELIVQAGPTKDNYKDKACTP